MKRVLINIGLVLGAVVAVVVLVAAGLLIWIGSSETALRYVFARVAPLLPDGVSIETVDGRLFGQVALGGIEVRTQTLELEIERAELEWNPRALVHRVLDLERLDVRGIDAVSLPAPEPSAPDEPFRLPERISLPVDVHVGGVSLADLRYRSSPEAEPLAVERVSFAGSFDDDALELRELAVRAPLFDVSGEARVAPHGAYATAGRLDWALRPTGYPEARGSARFSGDRDALTIEQGVEPPYDARATARLAEPLTALRVDADVTVTVRPAALGAAQVPAETVASELSLRGALDDLELTGRVMLGGGYADGVSADFAGRYAGSSVEIRSLDVAEPASGAAIHVTGRATPDPANPVLDVTSTWSDLAWPFRGEPQVRSGRGTLALRGTPSEYTVELDGDVAVANGTAGKVSASGTGGTDAVRLERVDVETLGGRIVGSVNASWAPKVAASAELTGTDIDPGLLLRDWPGRLAARVRADAALDGEALTVELHDLAVNGELRDRPVDLTARGGYAADAVRVDALALKAGRSDVSASGTAGKDLALEWRVESPDLADFSPDLAGRLSAHGELHGPRDRPRVVAEAEAHTLRFRDLSADGVELAADVDAAGNAQSSLALAVASARAQGTELGPLRLTGGGNAAHHELALSATTSVGNAEIALTGSVADPWKRAFAWNFAIESATVAYAELAPWQLREPATGRVTRTEAELARSCWQSSDAELCVEGKRGPQRVEARFALSRLPFDYFAALLDQPARIEGDLDVEGTFEQPANGTPTFDARLTTSPGRISSGAPATGGGADAVAAAAAAGDAVPAGPAPVVLTFGPAEGRVAMTDDRIDGSLRVPFADDGAIEASARIGAGAGAPFGERALDGRLSVAVASLGFVSDLVTQLQDMQGSVNGDLMLSGTVGVPRVDGTIALADGRATLPDTNVELEDVALSLTGDGARGLTVNGRARSGGGTLDADGRFSLTDAGPEGRITMAGDAFEVVDTADAQVVASPDLALELAPDGIALTGTLSVPRARLTPRDTGEEVVAPSSDQRIVTGDEDAEAANARPITANVKLALGDDVTLQGYGLTGKLAGAVEIREQPGEPTTGTGELRVEQGTYEAYGQKLEIEMGRVVFAGGPITDPGVDIRAVRRPAEGVLVGARVRGLLTAPELTVFSEPPMAQQEQLSYLVLGRPLESASASESSAMSQAALALGLKGGNFVSKRINQNLGLDAFGIEADPGEPATKSEFVIGKYLTPSLYVSYGVGLFEPVNTLKLRYAISQRWRLVTESSSEASGGDVIYNVERR